MRQKKPDIVAISETHLKGDEVLNYFGYINIYKYIWEGENHRNARKADWGVGFFIKKIYSTKDYLQTKISLKKGVL